MKKILAVGALAFALAAGTVAGGTVYAAVRAEDPAAIAAVTEAAVLRQGSRAAR